MQPLYTMVFRQAGDLWLGVCLENGLVSQGDSRAQAKEKLLEALESFSAVLRDDPEIYQEAISIRELHEFLTWAVDSPPAEHYELQAVYA